ncbi:DUF6443 domain-containing protein [Aquimarina sp. 2201CG1-2-11]|uniref:DUF6443 domain-containing protein n=1 Tax=Aquimarina discodermiae TaxID=3231043 RepID=UPI003461BB14
MKSTPIYILLIIAFLIFGKGYGQCNPFDFQLSDNAIKISYDCGSATLEKRFPSFGDATLYWQSSPTGTSKAKSLENSITLTSGSKYYIRAMNRSRCWSNPKTITYSIPSTSVPVPLMPNVNNQCGKSVLSYNYSDRPVNIYWYWQSTPNGTSTSNSRALITRTTGTQYYLRAKNIITGCWSAARTVFYNPINQEMPNQPIITNTCNTADLSFVGNPPSGVTWYWQSSPTDTSTKYFSSTYTVTRRGGNSGTWYLRAKSAEGCWSAARAINYTIETPPAIPTIQPLGDNCGQIIIKRNNPPSGVTWYWQTNATGTSTANANASVTLTSGSVYYLRAKYNSTNCWSDAKTINYSVRQLKTWYQDRDGDNFAYNTVTTCDHPGEGYTLTVLPVTDCEPRSAAINPNTVWCKAVDNFTDHHVTQCEKPGEGYEYNVSEALGCSSISIPIPAKPTITYTCSNKVILKNIEDGGLDWERGGLYWQHSPTGTCRSRRANTDITLNQGSTYYLRRLSKDGCWSPARKITYLDPSLGVPTPTQPIVENECGRSILTFNGNEPEGIDWYWQNTPTGTKTNINNATIYGNSPEGVMYLRAKYKTVNCWSTAVKVSYTHNPLPKWYSDIDNDGFGDPNDFILSCTKPDGYIADGTDECPEIYGTNHGCIIEGYTNTQGVSPHQTYRFTRVYQEAKTDASQINAVGDVIETVSYHDGLGRAQQQIGIKASPSQKDIVTHFDLRGRTDKEYLPFERANTLGDYKPVNITNDINSYYKATYPEDFTGITTAQVNAYSQRILEVSPLGRTLEQGAPGNAWLADPDSDQDHTIKFGWDTNTDTEAVYFKVSFPTVNGIQNTESPTLVQEGHYKANQLSVTTTKDENWQPGQTHVNDHTTKEYTDKQGRVILKRTYNNSSTSSGGGAEGGGGAHDTYYVYDIFGNLTFVIPPKVDITNGVSDTELVELCYQYRYDDQNRLVEKKIPGKGWEFIVYNKLNQPVMTQDANQRVNKEWLFTKYDVFGRVVYKGKIIDNRSRNAIQNEINAFTDRLWVSRGNAANIGGTTMYYTNDGYPSVGTTGEVLAITYYDDYDFLANEGTLFNNPNTSYGVAVSNRTKSLSTGTKTKILGTNDWITAVNYFDKKARPIYAVSDNTYLQIKNIVETKFDFVGKVKETKTTHIKGNNAAIVTVDTFTYDHMGRSTKHTQTINGQEEIIAENTYDALGLLTSKTVGGGLQNIKYHYNVRGWLKGINDVTNLGNDLFAYHLGYNVTTHQATPQYTYNIAEIDWKTASDNIQRWYAYEYNGFEQPLSVLSNDGNYSVSNITYDTMGNILSLTRNGWQNTSDYMNLDVLTYAYDNGNKLLSVTDTGNKTYGFKDRSFTGNDYDYDSNGNLVEDKNKGITNVSYNHFNLPTKIDVTNPEHEGNVQYIYNAKGIKLKKTAVDKGNFTTIEYNGNFVYENGSLKSITHPEGYIEQEDNGTFTYVYEHRDIWQNTRITYADDNKDGVVTKEEIRREQNYYPFGMQWEGVNTTIRNVKNNLKTFQGQELTEDLGLNTHEWKYRISDRSIGRFWQIDPLSEDYVYNATYAFQENKLGSGVELEGLENSSFESRQRYRDKQLLSGNITSDEYIQQGSAEGKGALAGLSLLIPGPEDIVIAGVAATKIGGAIINAISKVVGKIVSKGADEVVEVAIDAQKLEERAAKLNKVDRSGKDFTKAGKEVVKDQNKLKNGGKTKCENCKTETVPAKKSEKGVTPPRNETQVDHINPKSNGGRGNPDNGQVLCRSCNREKSDKLPNGS